MTTPYPYQEEGVRRIEGFNGRCLLADEMGLGKTLQTLLFAQRNPTIRPIIVVCPASLKWVWEREAKLHVGMRAEILEGTKPDAHGFHRKRDLIVVNYDVLRFWLEHLLSLEPKLVVFDEIQALGNRSSKRSKAARFLCLTVPHVLGLSGTPLTNRPSELWHPLNLIRPDLFPSWWPFAMKFCGAKRTFWGWDFRGASCLDELHSRLVSTCMVRRRKEDILADLPAKRRSIVPVEIEREEYEEVRDDYLGWVRKRNPEKLSSAEKTEQLGRIGDIKQTIGRLKLPAVCSWTEDFLDGSDSKLVLFAYHRKVLSGLEERFADSCVRVDGSVSGRKRQHAVDKFLQSKKCRLFIGQIRAAGTGWSAKGVSDFAFAELDWTPGWHIQAEDRGHGIGRGKTGIKTHSRYLTARGTFEDSLVAMLHRKQRNLNQILDDGQGEDFNVVSKITEAMKKETER